MAIAFSVIATGISLKLNCTWLTEMSKVLINTAVQTSLILSAYFLQPVLFNFVIFYLVGCAQLLDLFDM